MRRRSFLLGAGAVAALACSRSVAQAEPAPPVAARLEALQREHAASIGVYAVNLDSGRTIAFRDGETFAMCSTFKGYAAARVLQLSDVGQLRLDDRIAVLSTDILPNSPVTEPAVGSTLTIAQLCMAALQQSDNAAANLLLRRLGGPGAITEFARSIGDDRTRLDRWETELNSAVPGDPRDTSTPRALGDGYRSFLTGTVLGDTTRQQLDGWMRANETSSMRAGLPEGWTTADKTGSGSYGSTNDIGIAYGPNGERLLLSIMTRSATDDPDAENMRPLIGEIASLVVPWLLGSDS